MTPRSPFLAAAAILAGALALAACQDIEAPSEDEAGPPATPRVDAQVVDGYDDLGGRVVDIALIPNTQPFLSRALVALDTGGYALIDMALGETSRIEGPRVAGVVAAPTFQLRGSPAPLVLVGGGEMNTPAAFVFLVEDGELIEIPMDPIATQAPITGLCAERVTDALIDLLVTTDAGVEHWRIRDLGDDQLSAQRTQTTPVERDLVGCAAVNGDVVGVAENGATRPIGESRWGFSDGSDVAPVPQSDGEWAFVARPEEGGATLVSPLFEQIDVSILEGFNTPRTPSPSQVATSAANYGGSFSDGVLVVAEEDRVNVIGLGGLLDQAKEALRSGS